MSTIERPIPIDIWTVTETNHFLKTGEEPVSRYNPITKILYVIFQIIKGEAIWSVYKNKF
jgi:hypothetical protein